MTEDSDELRYPTGPVVDPVRGAVDGVHDLVDRHRDGQRGYPVDCWHRDRRRVVFRHALVQPATAAASAQLERTLRPHREQVGLFRTVGSAATFTNSQDNGSRISLIRSQAIVLSIARRGSIRGG